MRTVRDLLDDGAPGYTSHVVIAQRVVGTEEPVRHRVARWSWMGARWLRHSAATLRARLLPGDA